MKKEITAATFTPRYDPTEDRIRLVINYQDLDTRVDLMLTRAFILKFLPAFDDYLFEYYDEDFSSVSHVTTQKTQKKKEKEKKSTKQHKEDSTNLTKTDNVNMKLYEKDPELLTKIDFIYDKKSKNTTLIFFTNDTQVRAVLTGSMLKQLIKTVKASIPNFSWGIAQNF